MTDKYLKRIGPALTWRTVQLAGVKAIYSVRLLVLAGLLSPDDFGLAAIATSGISFFLQITDLGIIPALVQGQEVDEDHYCAAWTLGILRGLFITVVVFLLAPVISSIFAEPRSTTMIQVLAFKPLIESLASIKVAGLIRDMQFRPLALLGVTEILANTIVSIALANSLGAWALVTGIMSGSCACVLASYLFAPHRPRVSLQRQRVRPLLDFGRWIFITTVIQIIAVQVLRIAISRNLSTAALGLYSLALQIAFLPAQLSGEVIGSVTFPLYARMQSDLVKATEMFRVFLKAILTACVPLFVLIIGLAPSLVRDVLGERWQGTEPVIQVLAIVGIIGLLRDAALPALKGLGYPNKYSAIEILQSFVMVTVIWPFMLQFGLVGTAFSWLVALSCSFVISIIFLSSVLVHPFEDLGTTLGAIVVSSGLGMVAAIAVDYAVPSVLGLLVAGVIGITVIIGAMLYVNHRFQIGLIHNIAQISPNLVAVIRGTTTDV
jgi:O-antigen/teichoic acid export membrane protein